MGGAERAGETILRGSGLTGAAGGFTATATGGAGRAGAAQALLLLASEASGSSGLGFLFLLLGLDGLQHVTGLDMREINFWRNSLRGARAGVVAVLACRDPRVKMRANLIGLIFLQRTGVGLAGAQAELCQYIKNLPLLTSISRARSLIRTLLIPPLFKICYPKPVVAHSYLMALAVIHGPVIV